MSQFIEIRSYNLKPGTREEFHRLFLEQAFPMLQRWNVDVVAYGPSLHDQDSYFLMRRYDSLPQREESENAFYGSDEWQQGPRESIIALIENYTELVLELDETIVQGLRRVQT
ncbi:MAG TPA: NIPSNAP family protein [Anaerolineales bacterium]|nr:NIPSNAP family protein [Anaerolineales bacterium]